MKTPLEDAPARIHANILSRCLRLIRLKPFDISTSAGRSDERHRRIALTAGASVVSRCISFSTALVTVPLTIHYLGPERYGLWMTITSFSAMMAFADLGLGNGLLNSVAAATASDDRKRITSSVTAAAFVLSIIAIAMILLLAISYHWIPWARIFNVTSLEARNEAGPALAIFLFCFALNLPVGIVQRIQLGFQRGFANHLCGAAGNLAGLFGVLFSIHFHARLPTLVLIVSAGPLFAATINGIFLFSGEGRWLRPSSSAFNRQDALQLLRVGGLFSLLNLLGILGSSSNNLLIAQLLGSAKVAEYSVAERLFMLSSQVTVTILAPLWPAYAEAFRRGDFDWIRRTLRRTAFLGIGESVLASILLIAFRHPIYTLWVGAHYVPQLSLLIAIGIATAIVNIAHPYGIFLFSINSLRFCTITTVIVSVVGMGAKIFAVHFTGVAGIAWGTAASQLIINTIPIMLYVPFFLRCAEKTEFMVAKACD